MTVVRLTPTLSNNHGKHRLARTRGCSEQCHTVGTKLDDVVHHSILYGVKS